MNPWTDEHKNIKFELFPAGTSRLTTQKVFKRRNLIGSSQACDIVIASHLVSPIHGILEIVNESKFKIYDMGSDQGIFLNGTRVVAEECQLGDTISFGSLDFVLKKYSENDILPPPLNILADRPDIPVLKKLPTIPKDLKVKSSAAPKLNHRKNESNAIPELHFPYPLGTDPKAEFSEYIFEDSDEIWPIFRYEIEATSIEIIILFKQQIRSIDYLPEKDGIYKLAGISKNKNEVEYAYLGKNEKINFVEVKNKEIFVYPLPGYKVFSLKNKEESQNNSVYNIEKDDILRFYNGDIEVYVRLTESPPIVDHAPLLRRDKDFKKYLILMILLASAFLGSIQLVSVDEDLEKEKVPERIASILYKKELSISKVVTVDKTEKADPKKIQKSPQQEVKKVEKKEEQAVTKKTNPAKEEVPKVAKIKKGIPQKQKSVPSPRPVKQNKNKTSGGKPAVSNQAKTQDVQKTSGHVDTYKSADFKSSMNNLLSKGAKSSTIKGRTNSVAGLGDNSLPGSVSSDDLKRAKVGQNVGSLAGDKEGILDSSKGVDGIVSKKGVYTAGLPYKTVIVGGMDPNTIRQILMEHIPQFRACYQRELDRSNNAFDGLIRMDFMIGASGHVTNAGVDSASGLTDSVKGCVVNVLKGIKFPPPRGGGVVEVRQPFSFYPRKS